MQSINSFSKITTSYLTLIIKGS